LEIPSERGHLEDLGGENNIKMDLKEMGWEYVDNIHLLQDKR
jgi:hypothetical protein